MRVIKFCSNESHGIGDDTSQTAAQVLHFRYIVWRFLEDTFLLIVHWKRCLKDTFLLPLLTCAFPSLTISFSPNFALLLSLWVLLWFKTTSTLSEAVMFNFDTKDFHRQTKQLLAPNFTNPLKTPRIRFSTKKDPQMIKVTKYIQGQVLPDTLLI